MPSLFKEKNGIMSLIENTNSKNIYTVRFVGSLFSVLVKNIQNEISEA